MKTFYKILAALLLIFNGVGAIFGGGNLISHPDGSRLSWTVDMLKHTPFNDFLIPGIILLAANGIFSFVVLGMMIFGLKRYSTFIMLQGFILSGWILIQVIMLQQILSLHLIMGGAGLLLIVCGWRLPVIERKR